ncbi:MULTISPECIES: DUF6575 domain-containing protein [Aeromonas]|uniref:DUF6575 domain-containing protein n=1 Tax=Aeromonas TaxID=642 RepID=UPI000A5D2885|nr:MULTISPECIES: DUF6575 domain-containing protein [Aeromonas]MDD9212093.1 hypothetical protein [Aeromonas dhakensis]CAD7507815.1 hypothetical protein KBAH04_02860 [Aeromonas hydrophila]
MKVLPNNTSLGSLVITEIYDYFDGPKLFCARSKTGSSYICYWCDSADDFDSWLYLPVSDKKLEDFRRGKISVRDAITTPEDVVFFVTVKYGAKDIDTVAQVNVSALDEDFLPCEDFFVDPDEITFIDKKAIDWNHDVRIIKVGKKTNPTSEAVAAVISSWTSIFESLMNFRSRNQTLYPAFAVNGSFEVKFNTSNNDVASECLYDIVSILKNNHKGNDVSSDLYKIGLEPADLISLFDAMEYHGLELEISPRASGRIPEDCYLAQEDIHSWSETLESAVGMVLSTNKIPQADSIENVIKLLEMKRSATPINEESFGLVYRQIRYYSDAAFLLGFMSKHGNLTSQGRFLLEHKEIERMKIIAASFETTDCAMAWTQWAKMEKLKDVNAITAKQFILDRVPGLSESTAGRRAMTLTGWMNTLKSYL